MAEDKKMDELKKFANSTSGMFIKFDPENTPVEGIYLGYYLEPDQFNPGKERVVYRIEIGQQEKFLSSSSKRLATAVADAKPVEGNFIRITRSGEGFDIQYEVSTSDLPF